MNARRKLVLIAPLVLLGACSVEEATGPFPDLEHDPILFVHGYGRDSTDFAPMIAKFRTDGWTDAELYAITYGFSESNIDIGAAIRSRVNAIVGSTGAGKVDIIAHSMGSLSSRYYIRNLGGDARVDAWVSLAGPNHGTETATQCSFTPCVQMRIGSAFLAALNSGDETPGEVRYATWRTPCDALIIPSESVILTGAQNTETPCIAHGALITDAAVYEQVREWVR